MRRGGNLKFGVAYEAEYCPPVIWVCDAKLKMLVVFRFQVGDSGQKKKSRESCKMNAWCTSHVHVLKRLNGWAFR